MPVMQDFAILTFACESDLSIRSGVSWDSTSGLLLLVDLLHNLNAKRFRNADNTTTS
jgi:hypothetical protein